MLRLFSSQCLHELHHVASCVTKRSFVPVSACHHRSLEVLARHLNTGIPLWRDDEKRKADKSEDLQKVDLDKWKSVMRARAASVEKQQVNDEDEASDDDEEEENLREAAGNSNTSLLEATRDMVAMWRYAGKSVPQEMTDEEVQALIELPTKSSKKKFLRYLASKEAIKRNNKKKKEMKKAEREASIEQSRRQDSSANESKNTFLLYFRSASLDKLLAWRSAQSMMFGQPLVFDFSYESNMSRYEMTNTVSQMINVEGYNRRSTDPFHLHFCNLQPGGTYSQELVKRYGAETLDRLLITSTDRQHVDIFPREQLVYLTADSQNVLRKFDHSKVYIIGALVDRSIQSRVSLANAKRLKLATARLPLDEFLEWGAGGKNLTLDQMIRIMLTIKETGDWHKALQFVPKRKHDGFHQKEMKKEMTSNRVKTSRPGNRENKRYRNQ